MGANSRAIRFAALAAALGGYALGFGDVFGRAFGPSGRLITSKPTLVWEIWTTGSDRIIGVTASVDGVAVRARYDAVLKRVFAEPAAPFSPGRHSVEFIALFGDNTNFKKEWEFEVSETAAPSFPGPDPLQLRAIAWLNTFRRDIGLPEFVAENRLNAASLLHAQYHAKNGSTGHFQKPGLPLFFGADPSDRVHAVGYVGDTWETVEMGSSQPEEALRNLVDAPYHRIPFLQPGVLEVGCGSAGFRTTVMFQMSNLVHTAVYPVDDQLDVPLVWDKNERPNPFRMHGLVKRPTGYPIMLVHFAKEPLRLTVRSAALFDPAGGEVPCFLNTPENDDQLTNALILTPKSPLAPKTRYSVRVEAAVPGGVDVSRQWSFTTRAAPVTAPPTVKPRPTPPPKSPAKPNPKPAPKTVPVKPGRPNGGFLSAFAHRFSTVLLRSK